jgi:hypothetical protein
MAIYMVDKDQDIRMRFFRFFVDHTIFSGVWEVKR